MLLDDFYNLLTKISIVSAGIPLLACAIRHKALTVSLRALFVYLCVCFASDTLTYYYQDQKEIQYSIQNTFTVLECSLICFIYYLEFGKQKIRFLVITALIFFILVAVRYFIFLNMFTKMDATVSSAEAVILILFSAGYMLKFLFASEIKKIENYYFFWIVLSNLAYFGTALIFFIFRKFIKSAPDDISDFIWGLHDFINIGCYILFTVGIWKVQKK